MTTRQQTALKNRIKKEVEGSIDKTIADFWSEDIDKIIETAISMTLAKFEAKAA